MFLSRVTAATGKVLTLSEAREQCKEPDDRDNWLIEGMIAAACDMVAEMAGRVLTQETWAASYPSVSGGLELPKAPVQSVTSITYYDRNDTLQTAPLTDFYVFKDEDHCVIRPKTGKSWPTTITRDDAVTITFVAGYPEVPAALKAAALLLTGHLYENREASLPGTAAAPIPFGVSEMVNLHRIGWAAA
jgi:uncharacterized phiE125 gp8 family phage protein